MSDYRSNITIPQLARRILAANRVLITTHVKPDGDAMGSTLALTRALIAKGKIAHLYLMGPIEPNLITLAGSTPFRLIEREAPGDDYDLIIITDTGAWSQLEPIADYLKRNREKIIGIDHHTRGDDVAAFRIVEPRAVSSTAVLTPLLEEMECELSGGIGGVAEALFVGIATDSGWFRYENAGPDAFALAARLLAQNVNKSRLYQIIEENFGPQRLALEARALSSIEYARGGAVAIQKLRMNDFQIAGASLEDVTGLVNTPMSVGAVRVSILLTQTKPGETKMSFRSKPQSDSNVHDFFDVNILAQRFGGGGHVHAAGARVRLDLDQARAALLDAVNAM